MGCLAVSSTLLLMMPMLKPSRLNRGTPPLVWVDSAVGLNMRLALGRGDDARRDGRRVCLGEARRVVVGVNDGRVPLVVDDKVSRSDVCFGFITTSLLRRKPYEGEPNRLTGKDGA